MRAAARCRRAETKGTGSMICCWSSKGGSGTSVVAAALAVAASRRPEGSLLVDLCGDQPAVLGRRQPNGPGVLDWLADGTDAPPDALGRLEIDVIPGLRLLPAGSADNPDHGDAAGSTMSARGGGPNRDQDRRDQDRRDQGRRDQDRRDQAMLLATLLGTEQRQVVIDAGRVDGSSCLDARLLATSAVVSLLVVRPCYLALRRAVASGIRPTAVAVVTEPWRALTSADVAEVVGAPVVAEIAVEGSVARAVDAGLLATRLPRLLDRALRQVG